MIKLILSYLIGVLPVCFLRMCTFSSSCQSLKDSKAIENCQLRAARIATGATKGTSCEKLYCETQWSKLEERRYDFKLCFMHKVVHWNAPEYLVELLPNTVNTVKCSSPFYIGVRKFNVIHAHLRMNCSN